MFDLSLLFNFISFEDSLYLLKLIITSSIINGTVTIPNKNIRDINLKSVRLTIIVVMNRVNEELNNNDLKHCLKGYVIKQLIFL